MFTSMTQCMEMVLHGVKTAVEVYPLVSKLHTSLNGVEFLRDYQKLL